MNTALLVLPDPQDTPFPAIRTRCREIYDRRDELIGELDLSVANRARIDATSIEKFIGNREGRDDARRSARILECAVGAALGDAQWGGDRKSDQVTRKLFDPDQPDIPVMERYRCRLLFEYRHVWEPLLVQKGLTRQQALTLIKIHRNQQTTPATGSALIQQTDWRVWLEQQTECDLLLTDPPYSTEIPDIKTFAHTWLPLALSTVVPTGRAYVCIGAYPNELHAYLTAPRARMHLAQVLVWTYRNTMGPAPKLDYKLNWQAILYYRGADAALLNCPLLTELFSVQDINAPNAAEHGFRYDPWQKPDLLGERFIRHATKPGDVVFDPFAGTGSFLLAAARLGRDAIGCDHDARLVDIALERGCRRE